MSAILLCNQPLNSQALQNHCGINLDLLSGLSCEAPTLAAPNTPYLVGDEHFGAGRGERATNIARSSRNAAKLNVTSHVQANNLVKLSR